MDDSLKHAANVVRRNGPMMTHHKTGAVERVSKEASKNPKTAASVDRGASFGMTSITLNSAAKMIKSTVRRILNGDSDAESVLMSSFMKLFPLPLRE